MRACSKSSAWVWQVLRTKRCHSAFVKLGWQRQHLTGIPTPYSPLQQAPVLVELNNIPQPFDRNFGQTTLDIAATAASTDRDLSDHEALRFQWTISILVHSG